MQEGVFQKYGLIGLIVILILIGIVYYFYFYTPAEEPVSLPKASEPAVSGTLPSINTQTDVNVPEINPVDKANPFKNVYTNPFQ